MEPVKSDLIENRQIRVFISSTFRDMQAERDHLVTKVFPALRRYCEERDVSFFELDLRWGISEEESKQGKVMDICLKEIQKTTPFFIGLLGERYGWVLSEEDKQGIASNTNVFSEYPWIQEELAKDASITEIEIQQGVLRAKEKVNAYFYFRSPKMKTPPEFAEQPGSREEQKLRVLKAVLRDQKECPVQDYESVEHLGTLVEKDFKALVDRLFPSGALSPLEKERLEQRAYLKNKTGVYIPVPGLFEKLDDFVEGDGRFLVIGGGPGMGKSALLANWIAKNSTEKIIYHGIGVSGSGDDYRRITGRLINEVRDIYGLDAPAAERSSGSISPKESPDGQTETLQNLLFSIEDLGRLVIVLDGMDKLLDIDNVRGLAWLPAFPQNVRVIFSARQNDPVMDSLTRREYPVITVEPLSVENRKALAVEYLKTFGKGLLPAQLNRIASNAKSANPLVLRALLDELRVFSVYEQLDAEIDRCLAAPSIESFFALVLEGLEKLFTGDGGANFAADTFALLEVSRAGLSEAEILAITGANPLHWSRLYSALSGHVQNQKGLVSFAHDFIREAVRQRYLSQAGAERDCRVRIVSYMETSDVVSQNRKYDETPQQLFALKDWDKLYSFLMNLDVVEYIYGKNTYELEIYWRALREADTKKYSLVKYLELNGGERSEEALACLYNNIGMLYSDTGDYPQALDYFRKALTICEKTFGTNHPDTALAYNNIGGLYSKMGGYHQALKYYRKALEIYEKTVGTNHPDTALAYNNIGMLYSKMGDYPQALEYYRKALAIQEEALGTKHPDTARSYNNIGSLYSDMEDYLQALEYCRKALAIQEEVLGTNHPDTATSYNNIGLLYSDMGNHPQALEYCRKASAIWEEALGTNHPDTATSYNNISMLYSDTGDYQQALEYCRKALEIREEALGTKHPDTAISYNNIGTLYGNMKDYPQALEYYRKALEIREEVYGKKHLYTAEAYNTIGSIYNETGDYSQALEYSLKALAIWEEALGLNHPRTAESYDNTGMIYNNMGDYPHALDHYQKALEIYLTLGDEKSATAVKEAITQLTDTQKGGV